MASASPLPIDLSQTVAHTFDVLIVGGGNAALCAAISAARGGKDTRTRKCSPSLSGRQQSPYP